MEPICVGETVRFGATDIVEERGDEPDAGEIRYVGACGRLRLPKAGNDTIAHEEVWP